MLNMGEFTLYSKEHSPPSNAVLMTAEALGLEFDVRLINLLKPHLEHLKEDFIKINPQHTIPTLVDNGFVIWDSHAIMCYLCNKYAKDDSLYPKDPQKRALIDQRLHFESGVLFSLVRSIVRPLIYFGATEVQQDQLNLVAEAFDFLNTFLSGKTWLAGNNYTLADISCVTSVLGLNAFLSVDAYPNVAAWLQRCKDELPGYQKFLAPGNKLLHDIVYEVLDSVPEKKPHGEYSLMGNIMQHHNYVKTI